MNAPKPQSQNTGPPQNPVRNTAGNNSQFPMYAVTLNQVTGVPPPPPLPVPYYRFVSAVGQYI